MALNTYAGLKASYATWATRSDLTAQMDDFAFWAHQEIGRRLRSNLLLTSADVAIVTETVAQPTGFLAIKRFYLDLTPRVALSTVSSEMAADRSAAYSVVDYPDSVAVEGTQFRFAPQFSTATTGKLLYYQAPTLMVADGDTNTVLTAYPYLYLFGGLEALYSYLEDSENADRYGQKFGALLEDINARDASDTMSGPVQSYPSAGAVV